MVKSIKPFYAKTYLVREVCKIYQQKEVPKVFKVPKKPVVIYSILGVPRYFRHFSHFGTL